MALSYCTTCWDSHQLLNSDMTTAMTSFQQFPFQDFQLPPDDLLASEYTHSSPSRLGSCNFIDPFLPDDPFHYSHQSSFPPEILELDCSFQYPKRQRTIHTNYYQPHIEQPSDLFNGYVPNPSSVPLPEFYSLHEIQPPPPLMELQVPALPSVFDTGKVVSDEDDDQNVRKAGNGVSLSAQSIAARERRRKITEKTQKLAKLIPGGHKMNTAEMFQAASKYVKYLQAQVGVLQLLSSLPQVMIV
ncbi:transcription factor bHLH53-like [Carica papaya]|uniref:transcription factor bHLH53-like n=1 Tax=Carica papaya TaxID=3649 RepID=UPI000B8C9D54|nr:transcription factor bHLH53-like [Carica papaya]